MVYSCRILHCTRVFKRMDARDVHEHTHGKKRHACSQCNYSTLHREALANHLRREHTRRSTKHEQVAEENARLRAALERMEAELSAHRAHRADGGRG